MRGESRYRLSKFDNRHYEVGSDQLLNMLCYAMLCCGALKREVTAELNFCFYVLGLRPLATLMCTVLVLYLSGKSLRWLPVNVNLTLGALVLYCTSRTVLTSVVLIIMVWQNRVPSQPPCADSDYSKHPRFGPLLTSVQYGTAGWRGGVGWGAWRRPVSE
jgi:hypothetical protein